LKSLVSFLFNNSPAEKKIANHILGFEPMVAQSV